MRQEPKRWDQKLFDVFKVLKDINALKTIELSGKVHQTGKDVATLIHITQLQNEVYETAVSVRDMDKMVDTMVRPGGPLDLNQKWLTTDILPHEDLQRAIDTENIVVVIPGVQAKNVTVCCDLVTCYLPGVVPIYHSGDPNRTILFLHYSLPKGNSSDCEILMEKAHNKALNGMNIGDTRNGFVNKLEQRIAKSVAEKIRKEQEEEELVDGISWNMGIWLIVLASVVSVITTLVIVFGIFWCRDHSKITHWDEEGIENAVVELKDKSAKKLASGINVKKESEGVKKESESSSIV